MGVPKSSRKNSNNNILPNKDSFELNISVERPTERKISFEKLQEKQSKEDSLLL